MRKLQEASSRLHAAIGHVHDARGRNFICSPVSALLVFLMAMRGARGPTYNEMKSFLGITQMPALPFSDRPPAAGVASPDRPSIQDGAGTSDSAKGSLVSTTRQEGKKKIGNSGRKGRPGKGRLSGSPAGDSSPEWGRPGPGDFEYAVFNLAARLYVSERTKSTQTFQAYQESVREATRERAGVYTLDFSDGPQAEQVVNAFVSKATENRIQHIIPPGLITPQMRLLAVSAAFFGSRWKTHFQKSSTGRKAFYATREMAGESSPERQEPEEEQGPGEHPPAAHPPEEEAEEESGTPPSSEMQLVKQMVLTMFVEIEKPPFYVQETSDYIAVGLPYTNEVFVMFLVMPRDPRKLPLLTVAPHKRQEMGLEDTHFPHVEDVIQDMKRKAVTLQSVNLKVHLPKFSLKAQDNHIDLKTIFAEELDVPTPFSPGDADFQGIDGGREKLYISDFVHAGEIEVDERGTRAAGATAVTISARCRKPPPKHSVHLHFDRPFYFQIRFLGQKPGKVSDDDDDKEDEWEGTGSDRQGPGEPSREGKGASAAAYLEEEVDGQEDVVLFSGEVHNAAAAQS